MGALAVAGALYFSGFLKNDSSGGYAVVYVNGAESQRFALNENGEYKIDTETGYNIIVVENNNVFVKDADCPDKICVNSLPISMKKQSIVCLPHKLVVEIEGVKEESDIDSVSR